MNETVFVIYAGQSDCVWCDKALDEEYLKVDAQFGGVDQRKIFVFAEKVRHWFQQYVNHSSIITVCSFVSLSFLHDSLTLLIESSEHMYLCYLEWHELEYKV